MPAISYHGFVILTINVIYRAVASLSLPGGQVTNISPIFPHLPLFALILPQFFLIIVLILVLRVGESPTREGPGYATGYLLLVLKCLLLNLVLNL